MDKEIRKWLSDLSDLGGRRSPPECWAGSQVRKVEAFRDKWLEKGKRIGWKAGKEFGQVDGHLDSLNWLLDDGSRVFKALGIIIVSRDTIASMRVNEQKIWKERAKARYEYE